MATSIFLGESMNSRISVSMLLAAATFAAVLTGCNATENVREEPSTPSPAQTVVLTATATGLSTRRPVTLVNNGVNAKRFFATAGAAVTPLDLGDVVAGSAYNITVKLPQPFGKICTVANGAGVAGAPGALPITVSCSPDPAVTRYPVTVNTSAVSSLPSLTLTLETEDGKQVVDATGKSSHVFDNAIFDSLLDVPTFQYKVTATTNTTANGLSVTNNCLLTAPVASGRPGMNTTINDDVVKPTGPATMSVSTCSFVPSGTVAYSTPSGGTAQAIGAMTLGLKDSSGTVVQTLNVPASATTFAFQTPLMSNSEAAYELVITSQPTGQFCVVSGTTGTTVWSLIYNTTGSSITAPTAGAVLLLDPVVPDWWAFANRVIRCRAIPAPASRLTGTYQMDRPATPPATTTTPNPAVPARPREFLTFFADGTFLYGINYTGINYTGYKPPGSDPAGASPPAITTPLVSATSNGNSASGVIHGFYSYNPGAGTITFTVTTTTNLSPFNSSLTGMPGYTSAGGVGSVTATNVIKTPGTLGKIAMTFNGNNPAPVLGGSAGTTSQTRTWNMTEPVSTSGAITGTWVSADHRRVFAYNDNEVFVFHMGVAGVGNIQDACMIIDDNSTPAGGFFGRRGGATFNCAPGGAFRVPDLPNWTITGGGTLLPTVLRIPPGFDPGRFPGSGSQLDGRPTSPALFSVTPGASGAPDTLTAQNTLNGVPIGQPAVFQRERAN